MYKLLFLVLLTSIPSYAQITAFTEKGDTVYLWDDGTWEFATEYSESEEDAPFTIDTNYTVFTKGSDSKKVLKGQKVEYSLWYDASEWLLTANDNSSKEYSLKNKDNEAYCLVIPERVTTTIEGLLNIAITNAKDAAQSVEINSYEMRNVNGVNMAMMKMIVVVEGIRFCFMGYYYVGEDKTIQVITYTPENLIDDYAEQMEKLLNGFVVNP